MERAWINQPSTLDTLHALHGTNVLADFGGKNETEKTVQIFYLSGEVHSSQIPRLCLSKGWISHGKPNFVNG